jgi:hypothetical protein
MAKVKPCPNRVYPTTEKLKKMTPRQYAIHWARICEEIRLNDPHGEKIAQRMFDCPQSFYANQGNY